MLKIPNFCKKNSERKTNGWAKEEPVVGKGWPLQAQWTQTHRAGELVFEEVMKGSAKLMVLN